MPTWLAVTLAVVGAVAAAMALVLWGGAGRWRAESTDLQNALADAASPVANEAVDFAELDLLGLPDPVLRYFRWALTDGQPRILTARILQQGEFLLRPEEQGWARFSAMQVFSADPPGFVWDARIQMAPLASVRVRDAYDSTGRGGMEARVASLVTVMNQTGRSELDEASLQRFLAEAVWIPTALLPSEHLSWTAIDGSTALATLTDPRSDTSAALQFRFGEQGEITDIYTPSRYREVDGEYELAAWAGSFWAYEEHKGMMIPIEGEVEWQLPNSALPYWKGRLVEVEYEFSSP